MNENVDELQSKIQKYQDEIERLQALNSQRNMDDTFERIAIVEANQTINDYTERIQRLQRRIAGQSNVPAAIVEMEERGWDADEY